MFIELTELLVCPACSSAADTEAVQGLIAIVDSLQDRRILAGSLGCSECEARYPIRGGRVSFGPVEAGPVPGESRMTEPPPVEGGPESLAIEAAALLGETGRGGVVLLGEGLSSIAQELGALTPNVEIISLPSREDARSESRDAAALGTPESGELDGEPHLNWLLGVREHELPLLPRRLSGVVLAGGTEAAVAEASRLLRSGGRLVILRPRIPVEAVARGRGLEPLAAEPRAIVARRL